MVRTTFNLIFREKPARLLLTLLNTQTEIYASTIAKKIDCTYSHIVKILQEMERYGLVIFKKKGRLKIITLTRKGEEIARSIYTIDRVLK
jgi:Mn-dependent DtxR family transcriptional regulator